MHPTAAFALVWVILSFIVFAFKGGDVDPFDMIAAALFYLIFNL